MVLSYKRFLESCLFDRLINESVLYISNEFEKILTKMSSDIANDILSLNVSIIKPDITLIDIDREGYLSYTTSRNVIRAAKDFVGDNDLATKQIEDFITTNANKAALNYFRTYMRGYAKYKTEIKIGRLINRLFPGKYKAADIENFVNEFKAMQEKLSEKFIIVEGDDIAKWYSVHNYKKTSGSLGNSCMAKSPASYFKMYTENPEVCKMLILVEDDKLIGRALVWKISSISRDDLSEFEWFMDRQYVIEDHYVNKFRNYALDKKWLIKSHNSHHELKSITVDLKNNMIVDMSVELNKTIDYRFFPYLDTFRLFDPTECRLYNTYDGSKGHYLLHNADGTGELIGSRWSEYYGRYLTDDESVWSDAMDDYIISDLAVNVERGNYTGLYPEDFSRIVVDYRGNPLHENDAIWSESIEEYILEGDALLTIDFVDEDGSVGSYYGRYYPIGYKLVDIDLLPDWVDFLKSKFSEWNSYDSILPDLLDRNYKNEYILKELKIIVYKGVDSEDYFLKEDAEALNIDINESDSRVTDIITYNQSLIVNINNLKTAIQKLIKNYKNKLTQLVLDIDKDFEKDYLKNLKSRLVNLQQRIEDINDFSIID